MGRELEAARQRIEQQEREAREAEERAAHEAEEEHRQRREQLERDLATLTPELETIEQAFWQEHVPPRLASLFEEIRGAIEEREGIQMTEVIEYSFGETYPRNVISREPSGERKDQFEFVIDPLVRLWREGNLSQIPIQSVSLECEHRQEDAHRNVTVNRIRFEVNQQNMVYWGVGREPLGPRGSGPQGRIESQGDLGVTDPEIDDLAERMVRILEEGSYRYNWHSDESIPPGREPGEHELDGWS